MKPIGSEALKYNIKTKLTYGDPIIQAVKQNVPAPGHYEQRLALNKIGEYHFSGWKNSKAARWDPPSDRFKTPTITPQITPGPGTHNITG